MGIVYEAEQVSLGRRVALKVLPRHAVGSSAIERFRREARAAARLHHTNIVSVFEVGQDGAVSYYAMQLIQGCGLDQVIAELRRIRDHAGSFSVNRAQTALQPADALAVAPEAGSRRTSDVGRMALSVLTGRFAAKAVGGEPAEEGGEGSSAESRAERPGQSVAHEGSATRSDKPTPEPGPARSSAVDRSSSSLTMPGGAQISDVRSGERPFHLSVARIGYQVAGALAHAHARGIIHRDIKPSNLLLVAEGTVWITDFGLAKSEEEALTGQGDILGTLRYMAPERFRGESDPRSDVYSLGLTLYELLALRAPFGSGDRLRLIEQIKNEEPARPRAIDARIPRDLETIVLKAIEKDAKRRYATAGELGEDLLRFIEGEPIRARRVGELERLWMLARRHRTAAVLLSLFLVALVAGTAFSTVFAIRAARERDKAIAARADAMAVIDFLKNDLLAQAGLGEQGKIRPDVMPQPNLMVRTLLDRAAERRQVPGAAAGRSDDPRNDRNSLHRACFVRQGGAEPQTGARSAPSRAGGTGPRNAIGDEQVVLVVHRGA
ncbi:MAG: serine/threonine-protein kinase [Isosphaerales bacterium]